MTINLLALCCSASLVLICLTLKRIQQLEKAMNLVLNKLIRIRQEEILELEKRIEIELLRKESKNNLNWQLSALLINSTNTMLSITALVISVTCFFLIFFMYCIAMERIYRLEHKTKVLHSYMNELLKSNRQLTEIVDILEQIHKEKSSKWKIKLTATSRALISYLDCFASSSVWQLCG